MKTRSLLVLAWLMAFQLGCTNRTPGPVTTEQPAEIGVQVENHNSSTLVLYLDLRGTTRRLGEIQMEETLSWVFPYRFFGKGTSRLRAEVIGSDERVVTHDLQVQPGQVVRWILTPKLNQSAVALF